MKHTKKFTSQFFHEHPHKYNLFGLSSMLSDYGIKNSGIKILDKNEIHSIEVPFIAHTVSDFVIVEKVYENEIQYIERNTRIKNPLDEFYEIWTGYIMIAEPEYKTHFQCELFYNLRKIVILFILLFLFIFTFISNKSYFHFGAILLLIISFVGAYVSYLLVLKQLHIQNDYADKLCSIFKYSDCNNILESDASKLFGVSSWSEVGLGYFISNAIIICFLPSFIPCLLIINFFCIPYSIWSIWYQKIKTKQWCPLCLSVMFLLWSVFITGLGFGYTDFSAISFFGLIITGSIYLISVLIINMLISIITRSSNLENILYEINSIKADEDVFATLLKKQLRYEVNKDTSRILLGNPHSRILITVLSNPHCNPCSLMHKRINELLRKNKNICIQYIFSSFSEELDMSNKFLIGKFFQKNGEAKDIYDQWFERGKFNKNEFFKQHSIDINTPDVIKEFESHNQWKEKSGLRATPTILVNGYNLPYNFKIEDLRYFSSMNI